MTTAEHVAQTIAQPAARAPRTWAEDVIATIRFYAPAEPPSCERVLLPNDRLRQICQAVQRGDDATREDRERAVEAGVYAAELRAHATREAAKLDVLFGAWRYFAASEHEPMRECGELIRRFLTVAWRMQLVAPPLVSEGRRLAVGAGVSSVRSLLPDMGYV